MQSNNKFVGLIDSINVQSKAEESQEKPLSVRLQEMQILNGQLNSIIDSKTKEITEIVSTNTKSISIIAHDLRSPFSAIMGALQIIKVKLDQDKIKSYDELIEMASYASIKTLNLLDLLIAWAVSRNKEITFKPDKINLFELLTNEIENLSTLAAQKQIDLKNKLAKNIHVIADYQMIRSIFRNLIGNAIKFTNQGGEISISASKKSQFVEVVVKDNGIGISLEAQKGLFKIDEFKASTYTKNDLSTGLGLILCKEFVEQHRGTIQIKSETGVGSEFIFTLPICDEKTEK